MPLYVGKSYIGGLNINTSSSAQLPSLSNPATDTEVLNGFEYIDETGEKKTGTFTVEEELVTQDTLIANIMTALEGKAAGGGGASLETCTVHISAPYRFVMLSYTKLVDGALTAACETLDFEATLENVVCNTPITAQGSGTTGAEAATITGNAVQVASTSNASMMKTYIFSCSSAGTVDIVIANSEGFA